MSIDFSLLGSAETLDLLTHSQQILGFEKLKKEVAVLNNRNRFNALNIAEVAPASETVVDRQNNSNAMLYLTKGFAAPGVTFKADWFTSTSYCLTRFQWGNGSWAKV